MPVYTKEGALNLITKNAINKIKVDLAENVGNKVKFASKKGRNKTVVKSGVIEGTYPGVFVIRMDANDAVEAGERLVSYSYADILTHSVELALCE